MEVRSRDTYRVEYSGGISEEIILSLMQLYQPLIGPEATNLFLTMAAEGMRQRSLESHSRLFALSGIDPNVFDRSCARLEEYLLLRVYCRKGENRDQYIYHLNVPMSAKAFMQSGVYMSRLQKVMGQKNLETTIARLNDSTVSTQGYQDITRMVRYSSEEAEAESPYTTIQPRYRFAIDDTTINFDYERFIASTSALVFPLELRTEENLRTIGRLATVHGLSADRMRILVKRCINLDTMEFDSERLRILAEKTAPDITEAKDVYSLPPASFLQARQNGAMVTMSDRRILDHLALDMHFSNEVINVMIEYILNISDNRLNSRFVDMVAGEWARNGITTREQALMQTRRQPAYSRNGRVRINAPDYIIQQMNDELPEETKASREEIERIKELQAKMKD